MVSTISPIQHSPPLSLQCDQCLKPLPFCSLSPAAHSVAVRFDLDLLHDEHLIRSTLMSSNETFSFSTLQSHQQVKLRQVPSKGCILPDGLAQSSLRQCNILLL